MRVIGVIDLKEGRAVHARGGDRARYAPVAFVNGDAAALARHYRSRGVDEIYVADLDAIQGGAPQDAIVDALVGSGMPVWLDAGISTWQRAQAAINRGIARVVIGLETLTAFEALDVICISVGGQRVAFSLDLRNGVPIGDQGSGIGDRGIGDQGSGIRERGPTALAEPAARAQERVGRVLSDPAGIAARAVQSGVGAIIVLDLVRVGTRVGPDVGLIADIRRAAPSVMLLAGGGIRGEGDLKALSEAGCDGALAATMLQRP